MKTQIKPIDSKDQNPLRYPDQSTLIPVIRFALENPNMFPNHNDPFTFWNSYGNSIESVASYLIQELHQTGQPIGLSKLLKELTKITETYKMIDFFHYFVTWSQFKDKNVICQSEEENLIAVGKLVEDYNDGDPDPYETAGGYRSWKATAGTLVKYYLNKDLTITAKFESNCLVDHYNNNFFGNSTGGGTTKYKIGDRVEIRSFTGRRELFDKEWKKIDFKAEIKKFDHQKIEHLIQNNQPDLWAGYVYRKSNKK
jgi:hypothetical protein